MPQSFTFAGTKFGPGYNLQCVKGDSSLVPMYQGKYQLPQSPNNIVLVTYEADPKEKVVPGWNPKVGRTPTYYTCKNVVKENFVSAFSLIGPTFIEGEGVPNGSIGGVFYCPNPPNPITDMSQIPRGSNPTIITRYKPDSKIWAQGVDSLSACNYGGYTSQP